MSQSIEDKSIEKTHRKMFTFSESVFLSKCKRETVEVANEKYYQSPYGDFSPEISHNMP